MGPVKNRSSIDDPPIRTFARKSLKNVKDNLGIPDNFQNLAVQIKRNGSVLSQKLAVPANTTKHRPTAPVSRRSGSIVSGSSGGSSGGSHEGSDNRIRRRRRYKKRKKDNIFTRFREHIAESDVFISNEERPPYVACIYTGIFAIPFFIVILVWDTLTVTTFQIPHLSTIDHPIFIMEFQFIAVLTAMYGYCVQVLILSEDPKASLAKISIAINSLLFVWRVFLELYYDGYRSQEKHYLSNSD